MRKELYTLLFALLTLTVFTACSKDDDPDPITNTDLLVAHEWRGDKVLAAGIDVSNRPEITGQIGQIKTVRLKFNEDGTYNATYTSGMGEQSESGQWSFNEDETRLTFDLVGNVEVEKLTEDSLDLATKIPFQNMTFDAEIKFIK
ncbi:hypothetical protein [Pontibacter sp. H249]|uniref:hypothetical protein n=1 Tax=Pontibacter sp. H249 TaxID=3133420 RepID=UPI0030BE2BEC